MFSKLGDQLRDKLWYILSVCLLFLFIYQIADDSPWAAASFLGTVLCLVRGIYESTRKKEK